MKTMDRLVGRFLLRICVGLALVSGVLDAPKAVAAVIYADMVEGYENCRVEPAANLNYKEVKFTIRFKAIDPAVISGFASRTMEIYSYTGSGGLAPTGTKVAYEVRLGGVTSQVDNVMLNGPVVFYAPSPRGAWANKGAFTTEAVIGVYANRIAGWPVISVRGGAHTSTDWISDKGPAIYIGMNDTDGTCHFVTDPTKPPPAPTPTEIAVTAPDWNLGELSRGKETSVTLADKPLCFDYNNAAYIDREKYVISASNRNGAREGKYLLAHNSDASVTIPYTLGLSGVGTSVLLPGVSPAPFTLSKTGRTCLTPTFKAWAPADVKEGDFNDVLTFTIATTP